MQVLYHLQRTEKCSPPCFLSEGLGGVPGTHWGTETSRSLIITVLLDMDVKLRGEGRKLVPGQENIEHLICYTEQPPCSYLPMTYELISGLIIPFRFRQGVFFKCCLEKKIPQFAFLCFILQTETAGGKPAEAICTFFIQTSGIQLFLLLYPPLSWTPSHPSLPPCFLFFWCVCLHGFWTLSNSIWPQQRRRRGEKKHFHMRKLGTPIHPTPRKHAHTFPIRWVPRPLMIAEGFCWLQVSGCYVYNTDRDLRKKKTINDKYNTDDINFQIACDNYDNYPKLKEIHLQLYYLCVCSILLVLW